MTKARYKLHEEESSSNGGCTSTSRRHESSGGNMYGNQQRSILFCSTHRHDKRHYLQRFNRSIPVTILSRYAIYFNCLCLRSKLYHYSTNKNRTDASMIEVFKDKYKMLQQKGSNPSLHVLDNKCSTAIKTFVADQQTAIQLVEPHNHRVNTAEVAVKTAKYHFLAALATVAPECPLQLWRSFLP